MHKKGPNCYAMVCVINLFLAPPSAELLVIVSMDYPYVCGVDLIFCAWWCL